MEFSDLDYLLFSRIFPSGIGGYPPSPLNGIAYAAIGQKAYGTRVLMSYSLGRYDVYFKSLENWPTRPLIFRFRNWVAEGLWR